VFPARFIYLFIGNTTNTSTMLWLSVANKDILFTAYCLLIALLVSLTCRRGAPRSML